jgi:hypothetical protein
VYAFEREFDFGSFGQGSWASEGEAVLRVIDGFVVEEEIVTGGAGGSAVRVGGSGKVKFDEVRMGNQGERRFGNAGELN